MKSIPTNNNSRASFTGLADKMQHLLTGLKRLESLGASEILTSLAELSMNKELKHQWLNHTSKLSTTPPVEDVIAFIREKADQAEGEEATPTLEKYSEKPKHQKPSHQKSRGSHHVGLASPSTTPAVTPAAPQPERSATQTPKTDYPPCRYACPLCPNQNHYPYHCTVFKSYSTSQRKAHVQAQSLCINCLRPNHSQSNCRSTFKCKTCRGNHNSLLHEDQPTVANLAMVLSNTASANEHYSLQDAIMPTAEVIVTGTNGITMVARALLDSGSAVTLISSKARSTLALPSGGSSTSIFGVTGSKGATACPIVRVTLSSSYKRDWKATLDAVVLRKLSLQLPLQKASATKELTHLRGLHLADPNFDLPDGIDLLLGQNIYQHLFLPGEVLVSPETAGAKHTVFGWVIMGPYQPDDPQQEIIATSHLVMSTRANQITDKLLEKFWELEEAPKLDRLFTPEEQRVEKHYQDTHVYLEEEQRYMVKLPRILNPLELGESRSQAIYRAKANERSLLRKGKWDDFQSVMSEYLELGHARPVDPQDLLLPTSQSYYMPIHSVYKQSSSSTKVRAVFDASATTSTKVSLNDLLAVGPTIQPSLDQTLLRLRNYAVAISGDISKMYREIALSPEDRALHRFLWRANPSEPWTDYEMLRVTFGVTASP